MIKLYRLPRVLDATSDSRSALYAKVSAGLFTRPVRCGRRCVAWPDHEVSALNAARIAGKSDEEIRALVSRLEAGRSELEGAA